MSTFTNLSPRRFLNIWRNVSAFLGASTARIVAIASASLARGLAEAAVLVIVARVAIAVADDEQTFGFEATGLGERQVSITAAFLVAAGLAVAMISLHFITAALTARMSADALSSAVPDSRMRFSVPPGASRPRNARGTFKRC